MNRSRVAKHYLFAHGAYLGTPKRGFGLFGRAALARQVRLGFCCEKIHGDDLRLGLVVVGGKDGDRRVVVASSQGLDVKSSGRGLLMSQRIDHIHLPHQSSSLRARHPQYALFAAARDDMAAAPAVARGEPSASQKVGSCVVTGRPALISAAASARARRTDKDKRLREVRALRAGNSQRLGAYSSLGRSSWISSWPVAASLRHTSLSTELSKTRWPSGDHVTMTLPDPDVTCHTASEMELFLQRTSQTPALLINISQHKRTNRQRWEKSTTRGAGDATFYQTRTWPADWGCLEKI